MEIGVTEVIILIVGALGGIWVSGGQTIGQFFGGLFAKAQNAGGLAEAGTDLVEKIYKGSA